MEDFDTDSSGFAGADSSSSSSKIVTVALVIAVVGLLIGLAGLYMALKAGSALETYKAELSASPDPTANALSTLEAETKSSIDDIEGRLGNMGASIVKLSRQSGADVTKQLQEMHAQTQGAFNSVSSEVKANRTQLNEASTKLEQLIARVDGGAAARPASSSSSAATPTVSLPEGAQIHVIQPGEFMAVIARRYGVSLTNLMAANPTVEPRRMMPGDELVIPAN
jgi:LysM repeat protein|tara:strand:+ start:11338 stop:12009 length:672 start_codon:yes stop_codon:yes gene_type:complete